MNRPVITIELALETAELLRAKATARHLTLDQYLRDLASAEDAGPGKPPVMTAQERAARWNEWTTRHAVRIQKPADDSRGSIYTREDDAL